MFRYISTEGVKRMKVIYSCPHLNELFQEALKYHKQLLIEEEYTIKKSKWWFITGIRNKVITYSIFIEDYGADGKPCQAQYIMTGLDEKELRLYLYGVINAGIDSEYYRGFKNK